MRWGGKKVEDRCICCGVVIPEGRMICPFCAEKERKRIENGEKKYTGASWFDLAAFRQDGMEYRLDWDAGNIEDRD